MLYGVSIRISEMRTFQLRGHTQADSYTNLLEIWIASLEPKQTDHHPCVKHHLRFEGLPSSPLIFLFSKRQSVKIFFGFGT